MKKQIDYDTFMNLVKRLVEEQYDSNENSSDYDYLDVLKDYEEYVAPEKKTINKESIIDMTNIGSREIGIKLQLAGNIRIGKFLVRIKNERFVGEKCSEYMIEILEEKDKLHKILDLKSDKRFIDAPKNINGVRTEENLIELIYWIKMINKMPAFF